MPEKIFYAGSVDSDLFLLVVSLKNMNDNLFKGEWLCRMKGIQQCLATHGVR